MTELHKETPNNHSELGQGPKTSKKIFQVGKIYIRREELFRKSLITKFYPLHEIEQYSIFSK